MLGRQVPYFYELELEKFRYSQEAIQTGQMEIDSVVTDSAYTIHLNTGTGNNIKYTPKEIVFQAPDITLANATAVALVQSWVPNEHSLSVTNIAGEFIDGEMIIGSSSNAQYVLSTFDPMEQPARKENYDNQYIDTQAGNIVDMSESNPFGKI